MITGTYYVQARKVFWMHVKAMQTSIHRVALPFFMLLLPCEVQASLTDGLVAHYTLDANATDSSGYSNNGTVNGATPTADRFGVPNSAYLFDGIDDHINIPESTAFDSIAFSISLWFRSDSYRDQGGMLISKGQNNFEIHTQSELTGLTGMKFLPRFIAHGVVTDWHAPANSYALNEWTHVVGVYDPGNSIHFYVDGTEVPLIGPSNTPSQGDNLLDARLGSRTDGTLFFKGAIDDVRVYGRVLSAEEASQLFVVPEPSTYAMALAGLAGGFSLWRRRRA